MSVPATGLDRAAHSAKHLVVRDELATRIATMTPGQSLPSERELAAELGVARMTLRKAVDSLVADSLVVRRQGAGTFVAPRKVAQHLTASSFSEDMRSRGLRPGARSLSSGTYPASVALAACLGTTAGDPVLHVQRLRLADDVPMALEHLHVPSDLVPGLTGDDLVERSFYDLVRERYGLEILGGTQSIEPTLTGQVESQALDVRQGSPAFLFERTTRTTGNRILEFVRSVYRGDRYRIVVDISPVPPG